MKKNNGRLYIFLTAALIAVSVWMVPNAQAGFFDFWNGQVTTPGSEYYDVGRSTLADGGGPGYFTNNKGRILEVRSKEGDDGTLRVTVMRVYIPARYIGDNNTETREIDRIQKAVRLHASISPKLGEYVMLPQDLGMKAWNAGKIVEREIRRSSRTNSK